MASLDQTVAGLRCRDVLAELSALLDGELPDERVAAIRAHLDGCRACDRFGQEVAGVLDAVRRGLAEPPALARGVEARLLAGVGAAIGTTLAR